MDEATVDDGPVEAEAEVGVEGGAGAGAGAVAGTPERQARLDELALELGVLAAGTTGVARVQARPGAVEIARQALDGLAAAVANMTSRVGTGARAGADSGDGSAAAGADVSSGADVSAAGRSQPVVTLVVTDDETRVALDLAVDEAVSGPAVAREVAARLLVHLAEHQLPEPSVDVRIVGVAS